MRILFLDKVLCSPVTEIIRGVELFNLNLLDELAACGVETTTVLHPTWETYVREHRGNPSWKVIRCGSGKLAGANSTRAVVSQSGRAYDVLLQGNSTSTLIPALWLGKKLGVYRRTVVIAHRQPKQRVLRAQKAVDAEVVAVNGIIAAEFAAGGISVSNTYYGITNGEHFVPRAGHKESRVIRFCVLGQLDNAWKGADTAVQAFEGFPDERRRNAELHLASFSIPNKHESNGVYRYPWMPAEQVAPFLAGMDVMIVPSRDEEIMRETFSQAMVQGMLMELPILVNDLPVLT